jgi:hypothetical protein
MRALATRWRRLRKVIAVPDQHRAHTGLALDLFGQAARHRQHDVLLAGATPAHRARVLAAMPGVDGNHQVPATLVRPDHGCLSPGSLATRAR